jgi:hypothetical protein
MPKISELYPATGFLKAKDVEHGELHLQIDRVDWERPVGNGKTRNVVCFRNDGRELPLNAINARTIAKLHGDEGDNWSGCWITLFYDATVENPQTGEKGGVRVRDRTPESGTQGMTAPRPSVRDELDDEIPF